MPSHWNGRNYNLVSEDSLENGSKYTEQDFNIGINFYARIVGKIEVPQPNHRNEIVAAMRRIRYESKSNAQKKQRVKILISVDGIIVTLLGKKMKLQWWKNQECVIYQHPIHRVFYVSHDAQDINIFSYIVRDNVTDIFMCIAFKAYSEKEAIEIVGAIGHSFEICHKINTELVSKPKFEESNNPESIKTSDSKSFREEDSKFDFKIEGSSEKLDNVKLSDTSEIVHLENSSSSNGISNNIPSPENENKDDIIDMPGNTVICDSNSFKYETLLRLNKIIIRQNEEIKNICNGLNSLKMILLTEQKVSKKAEKFCQKIDKQNVQLLKEIENVRFRIENMERKFKTYKHCGFGSEDDITQVFEPKTMSYRSDLSQINFENSSLFNGKECKMSPKDYDDDIVDTFFQADDISFEFSFNKIVDENANFNCNER